MPFSSVNITMEWAGGEIMAAFKFKFQISSQLWKLSVIFFFILMLSQESKFLALHCKIQLIREMIKSGKCSYEEKPKKSKRFSICLHILYSRKAVEMSKAVTRRALIYCMSSTIISEMLISGAPVVSRFCFLLLWWNCCLCTALYTVETERPHILLCHIQ